jgi:hypothetical protein
MLIPALRDATLTGEDASEDAGEDTVITKDPTSPAAPSFT